jgi:hypothetical protein
MDLQKMKEAVGYDPSATRTAFTRKWAEVVAAAEDGPATLELIDAFTAWRESKGSKKAAASYKSLVTRYIATGELSKGKSGQSMKSAVNAFIWFCDQLTAGSDPDELDEPDEIDLPSDEEIVSAGEEE